MKIDITVDAGQAFAGLLLGAALASLYLTALWISVRRLARVRSPGSWIVLTGILRVGLTAAALVWTGSDGRWERLAGCMGGFLLVRWIAVRWVMRPGHPPMRVHDV